MSQSLGATEPSLIVAKRECASLNLAWFLPQLTENMARKQLPTKELSTQNDGAKFLHKPHRDFKLANQPCYELH